MNLWLGDLVRRQGKLGEAEVLYRDHLRACRRILGDEHPRTLAAMKGLARLLREMDRLEEAERLGAESVRKGRHYWLNERPQGAATLLLDHARTLTALGRYAEAEAELREAKAMCELLGEVANPPRLRRFRRRIAEAFTELHEGWHAAEPGLGYDMEAAEWRARLEEAEAQESGESM
jgi:tetratricopeptide (TPR) repeat protein